MRTNPRSDQRFAWVNEPLVCWFAGKSMESINPLFCFVAIGWRLSSIRLGCPHQSMCQTRGRGRIIFCGSPRVFHLCSPGKRKASSKELQFQVGSGGQGLTTPRCPLPAREVSSRSQFCAEGRPTQPNQPNQATRPTQTTQPNQPNMENRA